MDRVLTLPGADRAEPPDPRRWITLAVVAVGVLVASLDTTVLNVAIPTILHDFHTTLPSLQWVITGYTLTFAALMIIGGRLADIHGARQTFIVGVALFGIGSLVATVSNGVLMLVIGEAIIEGVGAALMLPSGLAILTSTFQGRERAFAFALWTSVMGAAYAFGPLLGGFLTTHFTWRLAFAINVVLAPIAIAGVLIFTTRTRTEGVREPLDLPGAALVASGIGLLVFGISEAEQFGWWRPTRDLTVAGLTLLPGDGPVSAVPLAFAGAVVLLIAFYRVERSKERRNAWPLFEFGQLRHASFRYGLATLLFIGAAQLAFVLVISVMLQDARHLSAVDTGLWLVPFGIAIIVGAQLGARLTRAVGTISVVRIGLGGMVVALAYSAWRVSPTVSFVDLLPGFTLIGLGFGFGGSQLTNVTLRDVPIDRAGSASGANSTVRMIGGALGIAAVSAILSTLTASYAVDNLRDARDLSANARRTAAAHVRDRGVNFSPSPSMTPGDAVVVDDAVSDAVASAARLGLGFDAALVAIGFVMSFLIPGPPAARTEELLLTERDAEAADRDGNAGAATEVGSIVDRHV